MGQNEEICYCLKAWNDLPAYVRQGQRPSKDDAMKVRRYRACSTNCL